MLSREATNTNFIVFGLTRSGLEAMIYCTQGKHANHYITDAVDRTIDVVCIVHKCVLYRTTDVVWSLASVKSVWFKTFMSESIVQFKRPDNQSQNLNWKIRPLCTTLTCLVDFFFIVLSSLKQQSADRHVATLWHIILFPSQHLFALSSLMLHA
jgi:hypothetical protein